MTVLHGKGYFFNENIATRLTTDTLNFESCDTLKSNTLSPNKSTLNLNKNPVYKIEYSP